ncbi:MAG: FkbM family methyltransferase [Parachlamydiales bacterium]|jgi:FkbM family methyltransferase
MGITDKTVRFLCRHYPFYSGCGKMANSKWLTPFLSKQEQLLSTLRSGEAIWINPQDHIGRAIDLFGDLDPKITWLFRKILMPGDICIDIGANFGLLTILAASLVGHSGRVIAVEPQKKLSKMIQASALENHFDNIAAYPIALSDRSGTMDIYIPAHNLGAASIEHTPKGTYQTETIQVVKVSEFLNDIHTPVKLIKIDVENHEDHVIQGAKDYLARTPAEAIIIEVHPSNNIWTDSLSLKILHELGYEIFAIPKTVFKVDLVRLDTANPGALIANDYLALHTQSPTYHKFLGIIAK